MSLQRVALIGKSPSRSFGDVCATVSGMAPANNTIPTIEANNCVELIMRCSYLGTLHAAALRLRSRIPTNLPEKGLKIIVPTMSAVSLRYAFMVCPVRLRRQSSLPQAGAGRSWLRVRKWQFRDLRWLRIHVSLRGRSGHAAEGPSLDPFRTSDGN